MVVEKTGMDSSSDGNSPVSYASVVRGYSSPNEKWSEYQKEGDAEATAIASVQSTIDDVFQVNTFATI